MTPPRATHRVRVIGGAWRGRTIRFADNAELRPTPDRVRETLFNWLGQELTGLTTLEPYAGSGVLSLEALSRGATHAVAVDRDMRTVRALRDNATLLGSGALEAVCADALTWLGRESRRFDVIFLDPPFASDPWQRLWTACDAKLAESGTIYAESAMPLEAPSGFAVHRQGRAGQVHYHLLRRADP